MNMNMATEADTLTSEVLDLFNKKTKSLKIIITPSN